MSLRILHVLDHSLPLQSGYAFRTLGILRSQRKFGWRTYQITSPKHPWTGALLERHDGWDFLRTPPIPSSVEQVPFLSESMIMRNLAVRIAEVVRKVRPDILHAHSPVLNALPTLWVGRRLGIPVVYEVRALWEDAAVSHVAGQPGGVRYALTRAFETFALKQADAVTVICEGLKREIVARRIPAAKVTVVPNAVDLDTFSGARAPDIALVRQYDLTGKIVIGFFGSFYRYEGLHVLLSSLPDLVSVEPRIVVLLVGGGPEEASLKRLAAELGVADKVRFAGQVPHSLISRYYDLVELLIFPRISVRVTELVTPLKPLEAMAQQRIVLASGVGGHRELIRDNETGYLFAPDDPGGLVSKVLEVLHRRDDWPEIGANGRHFVENERPWIRSVVRYKEVYGRLLTSLNTSSI